MSNFENKTEIYQLLKHTMLNLLQWLNNFGSFTKAYFIKKTNWMPSEVRELFTLFINIGSLAYIPLQGDS